MTPVREHPRLASNQSNPTSWRNRQAGALTPDFSLGRGNRLFDWLDAAIISQERMDEQSPRAEMGRIFKPHAPQHRS